MALADVSKRMHKLSQRAMAIRREADVLETQLQEAVAYRASMHRCAHRRAVHVPRASCPRTQRQLHRTGS